MQYDNGTGVSREHTASQLVCPPLQYRPPENSRYFSRFLRKPRVERREHTCEASVLRTAKRIDNVKLYNTEYYNAKLSNAEYYNAKLYNAKYHKAKLYNAKYLKAKHYNAKYYNAKYYNAKYYNAKYYNAKHCYRRAQRYEFTPFEGA